MERSVGATQLITLFMGVPWPENRGELTHYHIGGRFINSDIQIQQLIPYLSPVFTKLPVQKTILPTQLKSKSARSYNGQGWLNNQWREVSCWYDPAGYLVEVDGGAACFVSAGGNQVQNVSAEARELEELALELVLGPGLIMALALQGAYSLHASAAAVGDRVIVFLGESGRGKSTLARYFAQMGHVWRRVADDILPVEPAEEAFAALPHFPQLKLPADEQPSTGLPQRLPLEAIYVLDQPAAAGSAIHFELLGHREATLVLARHTVASRLFAPDLLAKHLHFCAETAARLPVQRLIYPRSLEILPELARLIEGNLTLSENSR